jgi:hypothetical protein
MVVPEQLVNPLRERTSGRSSTDRLDIPPVPIYYPQENILFT